MFGLIPQLRRKRPLLPAPTRATNGGRFVLGLIVLCLTAGCALPQGAANAPLLAAFLLTAFLLIARALGSLALRKLRLSRRPPSRAFAFTPADISLRMQNAGRLPIAALTIHESLTETGGGEDGGLSGGRGQARLPWISAGMTVHADYVLTIRRRGVYAFAPTRVETEFPFGLFRHAAEAEAPGRLTVYPRLGRIDAAFIRELETSPRPLRQGRTGREEWDFRGLREFRPDDNPKWIHWASSARLGELMVREFEEPQARRVTLIVDTHQRRASMRRGAVFEAILSFAASLAWALAHKHCRLTCLALPSGSAPVTVQMNERRPNPEVIWELLAGLHPDDQRTLEFWRNEPIRRLLCQSCVVILGLDSLRGDPDLQWLRTPDNSLRILDARSDEFRRLFRRGRNQKERTPATFVPTPRLKVADSAIEIAEEDVPFL
jgi:uncharacterized protein (DUF58 family)